MSKPFFSLILPVRDEASRLLDVLAAVDYALSLSEFSSEIILVDDGSHDATKEIAIRFGKAVRPVRIIEGKERHGIGWAVQEGLVAARGNVRCVINPSCISFLSARVEVIDILRKNPGIVIAMPHTYLLLFRRIIRKISKAIKSFFHMSENSYNVLFARPCAFCISEEITEYLLRSPHFSWKEGIFLEFLLCARHADIPINMIHSAVHDHSRYSFQKSISFYWDMVVVWWKERKNFYILPKKTEHI